MQEQSLTKKPAKGYASRNHTSPIKGPIEAPKPDHRYFHLYCLARLSGRRRQLHYRFNKKASHYTHLSKLLPNPHKPKA